MKTHPSNSTLQTFFVEQLQDIYWAEKDLVKNLKKMAEEATTIELKKAFEEHMDETEIHVRRAELVFKSIGEKPVAKKCEAMVGLVKEAKELISVTEEGSMIRDVALITGAQKIEHYEIASYGTLATIAAQLGYDEAEDLLGQTLGEEKNADYLLTKIAEGFVNESAMEEPA